MSVINPLLQKPLIVLQELNTKNMFIEVDQAIYAKVLDSTFKMNVNYLTLFQNFSQEYQVFTLQMYYYFENSGFINSLFYSGCRREGTIINALTGGEVKHGIQLYKFMCEAIFCNKLPYRTSNQKIILRVELQPWNTPLACTNTE